MVTKTTTVARSLLVTRAATAVCCCCRRGSACRYDCLCIKIFFYYYSPHESMGVCFTGVGLCVCLSVTMITKKIVDGFVPNFM